MEFNPQVSFSTRMAAPDPMAMRKQKEAAQDFESLFIQMSLKDMRPKTNDGYFSAGMAEDVFYQFMDEAIAKEVAKSEDNFGIAQAMESELLSNP